MRLKEWLAFFIKQMNLEKLERVIEISEEIKEVKDYIKVANYTQLEENMIRKTTWTISPTTERVIVPESLYRIFGQLIIAELTVRLTELENEFEAL